ncbi:MAG: cytochrome c peroxidase [Phototrophicaceae bacterium]
MYNLRHQNRMIRLLIIACLVALGGAIPLWAQSTDPTPRPLYALPASNVPTRSNNSFALSSKTGLLVVANMLNDTVSIVAPISGVVQAEVAVGADPRSVAYLPDNETAMVVNRGDSSLMLVDTAQQQVIAQKTLDGVYPYGVVVDASGRAYVSVQGSSKVLVIESSTLETIAEIPTLSFPSGLALWGDFLYVTHFWGGGVSLIYLPQLAVVQHLASPYPTTLSANIVIDPNTARAYLPQTRSYAENPTATYDSLVFPLVNVLQLDQLALNRPARLALDIVDRPVNMPFATLVDGIRGWLYVANAGSDDVSVYNLRTQQYINNIVVGSQPRGLLINTDNSRVLVHNVLDGSITVIDATTQQVLDELPVTVNDKLSVDELIGAEMFYSATDPSLSKDHWVSCANCHFDGMSDGLVWQSFGEGGRNTPNLFNLEDTAPYTWTDNWLELAQVEDKVRQHFGGTGFIFPPVSDTRSGMSLDLDTLTLYLATLKGVDVPLSHVLPETLSRGEMLFNEQGCVACHTPPVYTNQQAFNVGTGGKIDTPSLRWLALSAPYFHDGSALTLRDVFIQQGAHQLIHKMPSSDLDALLAWLLALPSS